MMTRRHRSARLRATARALLTALLMLTVALPAWAYTIYLKDGSRLIAREKYTIDGARAYIILENGTRSFIAANEIDVERTEKANVGNYGTALVLEDGKVTEVTETKPPPPPKPTLSDLVASGQATPQDRPASRRPQQAPAVSSGRTGSGAPDLATVPRKPYAALEVGAELQRFFRAQGLEEIGVYAGPQAGQPLIEVTASSEAAVFRALATASVALRDLRPRFPNELRGIDLLLMTSARERAGQFAITPALAADLVERRVEIAQFFVRNVQF